MSDRDHQPVAANAGVRLSSSSSSTCCDADLGRDTRPSLAFWEAKSEGGAALREVGPLFRWMRSAHGPIAPEHFP